MASNKFPAKAIERFVKDPTIKNLNKIKYDCAFSPCDVCPLKGNCPPPYANEKATYSDYFFGLNWKEIRGYDNPTLSEVVLLLSEALSKYEEKKRRTP